MSGQKCARTRTPRPTVNTAIQNASNNQRRINNLESAFANANRRTQQDIGRIQQANRQTESRLQNSINGLSSSVKQAEQRRIVDMQRQNQHFEGRLQHNARQVQSQIIREKKQRRQELNQTRKNLESKVRNAVGIEREARKRDLNKVTSQISSLDRNLRTEIKNVSTGIRKDMKRQKKYLESRMDNLVGVEREARKREISRIDNNIHQLDKAISKVDSRLTDEIVERKRAMAKQRTQLINRMDTLVGEERRQREADVTRLENEIDTLDQELRTEIARVEDDFKVMLNIEAENRRLEINNLREWTAKNFDEQRREYLDIAKKQGQEIQANRNAIREIFQKIEANAESASAYITDIQKVVSEGYESRKKDFEKYVPGDINKIIRRSNRAVEELNGGREQVAKAEAINAYEEWLDANEELEKKKREFEFWHQETLKDVLALFEIVSKNRKEAHHMHGEKIVEVDGKEEEVYVDAKVELDYWTNNQYSGLEKTIQAELEKLENPDALTLEAVKQIRQNLDSLKKQEQALIIEAEEKVIASQIRAELSDIAVEALQNEGFVLIQSGYDKSDQRRGYIINMQNNGGADVVVSFLPREDSTENVLDVQIRNEVNYSEAETQSIVASIITVLEEEGIQVGDLACEQRHLEEFYDFDKIFDKNGGLPQQAIQEKGATT